MWFTGLPGSGKSTIASEVVKKISSDSRSRLMLISMDDIRKRIFPNPTYNNEERDAAYRSFVLIGSFLSKSGVTVLLDGTGHKLMWRNMARMECPRFVEVYVKCPIEICMQRESARKNNSKVRKKLYADALARLKIGKSMRGLGKMPGIDELFEESQKAEIILDSSTENPKRLAEETIRKLHRFEPKIFSLKKKN